MIISFHYSKVYYSLDLWLLLVLKLIIIIIGGCGRVGNKFEWGEVWENVEQLIMWSMCLKSLVTIRKNEIFPYLACYGQKFSFFVQKSRLK